MRLIISFPLLIVTTLLWSQSVQQKYLDAKSQFGNEDYVNSIASFSTLASDPIFGSYSTFYLGLSHYKNGDSQKGLDALRQLLLKYPKFEEIEEVHFWITHIYFSRGDNDRAVKHAQNFREGSTRQVLYKEWLTKQPFQLLQQLQSQYSQDSELAEITLRRAVMSDLSDSDKEYIDELKLNFSISSKELHQYDDIRKDAYTVAVFLPFLFDDLDSSGRVMKNTLVMDLYQGMELASSMLSDLDIHLNLLPYDTKRDVDQTARLLQSEGLSEVDLIIGPLLPKPIKLVNTFSQNNEINLINPVSSNSKSVADNAYAYQMKPNYKTMARKAAEFVAANATKTESMIYFEDKGSEKVLALEYQKAIQELGFVVTNFQPIDSKSAREVLARFSDQEESILNITDEEALILLEDGRLIRNRETFDASGNLLTDEDGTPILEYYELNFTFDTDSLDHIFASTRSNLLANNFVGAIESIPDTVRLIGLGEWLDFSMLDYRQLERLNVNLIHSQYFDRSSNFYKEVQELCIKKFRMKPSVYHMLGFESVWWAGQMMHRYGKYFQNGFYDEQDFSSLFYGHKYTAEANDNQIVPIVKFADRQLKVINFENKSDEE